MSAVVECPHCGAGNAADRRAGACALCGGRYVVERGGGEVTGVPDPFDPYTRDSVGQLPSAVRQVIPSHELEASGRFRADPAAPLSAASEANVQRMAEMIRANRESHAPSPITDQLEAAWRLAAMCSPGFERVAYPAEAFENERLGYWFAQKIVGHRKPHRDPDADAAQQAASPLDVAPVLAGSAPDGRPLHQRVLTCAELVVAARGMLPGRRADVYCGFCHAPRRTLRPEACAVLLCGRGFWILATVACRTCRRTLNASARRADVTLTWVHPHRTQGLR